VASFRRRPPFAFKRGDGIHVSSEVKMYERRMNVQLAMYFHMFFLMNGRHGQD
jgi:hypothetical protein